MTTENNVAADANAAPEGSTGVDSQLAEMHAAESVQDEASQEQKERAPDEVQAAAPEVKKVVPLAALHEERRARQDLQRQIAERDRQHAEQMRRVDQRLEMLSNPQRQAPTREEDPVAYLDSRIGEVTQAQRQILQQQYQRDQQFAQERQIAQVQTAVVQSAEAFRREAPDLSEAVKHLNEMRARELVTLGAPPDQAAVQAERELDQATMTWAVQGRNPAQTAYEFAKARGYTPKAAAPSPSDKIAAQQRGVTAARSLGGGGAPNAGKLTAEALANMSDEDFSKLTEAQFKQAMGG